jgi:uncharacterized repeat protein (TIGR03803 family)
MTNPSQPTASISPTREPYLVAFVTVLLVALALLTVPTAQAQTLTVLHTFSGPDGLYPYSGVTLDRAGNLYGTTYGGGQSGNGTVYELKRHGSAYTHDQLHEFTGGSDGDQPYGGVAFAPSEILYGTSNGGAEDAGTVFSLQPPLSFCRSVMCPWIHNVLYDLGNGGNDQAYFGEPAFDAAGNIYATSTFGGISEYGTVYEVSRSGRSWIGTDIYLFQQDDAQYPAHDVILDSSGNVYGTTGGGGEHSEGAIFQLQRSGSGWVEHIIASFGAPDTCAGYTLSGIIMDQAGNIYGGTTGDGATACLFELSPSGNGWRFTVLYTLIISNNVEGPVGNLVIDGHGNLYGTTKSLGAFGLGNIFKLAPSGGGWTYTDLYDFSNSGDGENPTGDLTMDASGNLYGTNLGLNGHGVVWELTP